MVDEAKLKEAIAQVLETMKPAMAEANGEIKVGVSQRHIHLSREDVDILFGKGYELTVKKYLMGREYAAEEVVTLT